MRRWAAGRRGQRTGSPPPPVTATSWHHALAALSGPQPLRRSLMKRVLALHPPVQARIDALTEIPRPVVAATAAAGREAVPISSACGGADTRSLDVYSVPKLLPIGLRTGGRCRPRGRG